MFIESLDYLHFRNLEMGHLEFSPGFNVIYGDNAQGKSNLLEAIYTLSFMKGFRAAKLSELISFNETIAQISAQVRDGNRLTRLALEINAVTRKAMMDGHPCLRARDYLGALRSILFVPMDVGFLQTAPAVRRSALDRMVFNLHPAYLIDLDLYQKVVKQKSVVLRQETPDEKLLDTYDEQLLPLGARIIQARHEFFSLMAPHICSVFSSIFDENCVCRPLYKSTTFHGDIKFGIPEMVSADALVKSWKDYLMSARSREIARQQMTCGPHRDDWTLDLDGYQARFFASQGQQRSMSLALKLSEIECLKKEAGIEPVFLLDDVSSELDPTRHRKLFEHLNALTAQTFLTTTSKNHIHLECVGKLFHVSAGSIRDDSGI